MTIQNTKPRIATTLRRTIYNLTTKLLAQLRITAKSTQSQRTLNAQSHYHTCYLYAKPFITYELKLDIFKLKKNIWNALATNQEPIAEYFEEASSSTNLVIYIIRHTQHPEQDNLIKT